MISEYLLFIIPLISLICSLLFTYMNIVNDSFNVNSKSRNVAIFNTFFSWSITLVLVITYFIFKLN